MKTLEEIKAMRDELADEYENQHHKKFPDGMTVASYCNAEIPGTCYSDGYDAALELMLERERVAVKALEYIVEHELYHGLNQGKPSEQVAQETLDKLIKGENK